MGGASGVSFGGVSSFSFGGNSLGGNSLGGDSGDGFGDGFGDGAPAAVAALADKYREQARGCVGQFPFAASSQDSYRAPPASKC
jgi:hypothetical protein